MIRADGSLLDTLKDLGVYTGYIKNYICQLRIKIVKINGYKPILCRQTKIHRVF